MRSNRVIVLPATSFTQGHCSLRTRANARTRAFVDHLVERFDNFVF